jgi:hypothetical protein
MPIRFYSFSRRILVLITVIAGAVSIYLYTELQRESGRVQVVVATVPRQTTHFAVTRAHEPTRCFGEIESNVKEEGGQLSITYTSWLGARIGGTQQIYEASGYLAFNPLGQLGGSLLTTTINGTEVRLGSTNINPITLIVAVGSGDSSPLFKQNIPGPITADIKAEHIVIQAPALQAAPVRPQIPSIVADAPKLELTHARCDRAGHDYLAISSDMLLRLTHALPELIIPGGAL